MNDEMAIEALSSSYDKEMSIHGPFGGMYDTTDYRMEPGGGRKLIPGKTDRWGEPLEGGNDA